MWLGSGAAWVYLGAGQYSGLEVEEREPWSEWALEVESQNRLEVYGRYHHRQTVASGTGQAEGRSPGHGTAGRAADLLQCQWRAQVVQ